MWVLPYETFGFQGFAWFFVLTMYKKWIAICIIIAIKNICFTPLFTEMGQINQIVNISLSATCTSARCISVRDDYSVSYTNMC